MSTRSIGISKRLWRFRGSGCFANWGVKLSIALSLIKQSGEWVAADAINDSLALGIRECNDIHGAYGRAMGPRKGAYRRVSLADCAALARAKDLDALLLTADRHEVQPLHAREIWTIEFIRYFRFG